VGDEPFDLTTVDDTARFTARTATDPDDVSGVCYLSGARASFNTIIAETERITGRTLKRNVLGTADDLRRITAEAQDPWSVVPQWYLLSMLPRDSGARIHRVKGVGGGSHQTNALLSINDVACRRSRSSAQEGIRWMRLSHARRRCRQCSTRRTSCRAPGSRRWSRSASGAACQAPSGPGYVELRRGSYELAVVSADWPRQNHGRVADPGGNPVALASSPAVTRGQ